VRFCEDGAPFKLQPIAGKPDFCTWLLVLKINLKIWNKDAGCSVTGYECAVFGFSGWFGQEGDRHED
jgi:hypothetical protein